MEYLLAASVEELFEMLGVVAFLHAISTHLHERQQLAAAGPAPARPPARRPRPRPAPDGRGHGIALERDGRPASARAGVPLATDGNTAADLRCELDVDRYTARAAGKVDWFHHGPALDSSSAERVRPRQAMPAGEFFLEYQPIVRLADQAPVGFEALLRWSDPGRARLTPSQVLDVTGDTGAIVSIGNRVLAQAAAAAAAWTAPPTGALPYVSVDVSMRQFHTAGFLEQVLRSLARSGLAPHRLTLGIAETLLVGDGERVWRDLAELRRAGVRVAVEFSAGHSALDNLRHAPIDVLKLDRALTGSITTSPHQAGLVAGIIALAHRMRLDTVAAGIERRAELDHLLQARCTHGQGRLFARPMSDQQVRYWIDHPDPAGLSRPGFRTPARR
ncbi:EAL domain-containing protein [Catellatospora coxensis]